MWSILSSDSPTSWSFVSLPSVSNTWSAASHDAVRRWTHTFSRCPVLITACSDYRDESKKEGGCGYTVDCATVEKRVVWKALLN